MPPIQELLLGMRSNARGAGRSPDSIVWVGRAEEPKLKGLHHFAGIVPEVMRAWKGKVIAGPRPVFTILGAPTVELAKTIKKGLGPDVQGISDLVVLPYSSEKRALERTLRGARLVVVPSMAEPYGLIPLEALSCYTPVVLSDNSGAAALIREVVTDRDLSHVLVDLDGPAAGASKRLAEAVLWHLAHEAESRVLARHLRRQLLPVCSYTAAAKTLSDSITKLWEP